MDTSRHLEALGMAAASLLANDVITVRVVAEVHDDWMDCRYDLIRTSGTQEGVPGDRETNRVVNDALMDIRNDMIRAGQPDWHHCVYSLARDGTFRFDIDRDRPPSA